VPTSTDSKPTLALLGVTRNTDNYGVRVLLSASAEALATAFPGYEIIALDYGHTPEIWPEADPTGARNIRLINLRFSWKAHLPNNVFRLIAWVLLSRCLPISWREKLWLRNPWLADIMKARAHFSIAGGDSFSDIYGLMRLLYVALPQLLVLFMGRTLVQLPQTYGPFKSKTARLMVRYILRHSHTIYSRDEAGVAIVRSVTGFAEQRVTVVPDLGFSMSPQVLPSNVSMLLNDLATPRPLVGLNVSGLLFMGGYSGKNMFALKEPFPQMIEELISFLIRELGTTVLLVPHVCGGPLSQEDETKLCQKLLEKYRPKFGNQIMYIDKPLNHRQTKSLIGHCTFFLGARMHACVAAVSRGVPTVCLAYSGKFVGVMAPFGRAAHIVDLRKASTEEIVADARDIFSNRDRLQCDLKSRLQNIPPFSAELRTCFPEF
jgi:polysaccharide pyruvyl transferase WcaK-like protein